MIRRPPRSTLFPTRRSSDLAGSAAPRTDGGGDAPRRRRRRRLTTAAPPGYSDRKSTRLNSSHVRISYAVFCLKKKKNNKKKVIQRRTNKMLTHATKLTHDRH